MDDYSGYWLAGCVLGLSLIPALLPTVVVAQPQGQSVPVPVAPLAKGMVIAATDLTSKTLPVSQVFISTAATEADLVGLQTLRALPAGQPISKLHVRVAPLVARGSLVSFIFARGGVQLRGSAQAMEDGTSGQTIRLLNLATRATLVGVVQSNGGVLVN